MQKQFQINNAVMPLLGVTVVFFIIQMIIDPRFTTLFFLAQGDLFTRPWTILTHMFLHSNPSHIFFNMFGLLMFGPLLESKIGPKRFLTVYLGSGLVAGAVGSFIYSGALGASAAVMGMLGTLVILMPHLRLLFFFVIPMPLWVAGIAWVVLDTFGIFMPNNTANVAHLIGLGIGLLYGLYLKSQAKTFRKKFSKKGHISGDDLQEFYKSGRI